MFGGEKKSLLDELTPEKMRIAQGLLTNLGIKPGYRSENTGLVDEAIGKALATQMGRSFNFGYGANQTADTGFLQALLDSIGGGGGTGHGNTRLNLETGLPRDVVDEIRRRLSKDQLGR
jgi:hypothetical protein